MNPSTPDYCADLGCMVFKGGVHVQARYQSGTLDMLEQWFAGKPFADVNYIVRDGKIAPQYL